MTETSIKKAAEPLVQALLAPISENEPAGISLRYEGTYDDVRHARREDEALPQGIWETELKKADWQKVAELCQTALKEKSKDLQVATWLLEAWLQLDGLPGLSRGLSLIRELCVTYWDELYPEIENGDMEFRLAPIEWVNDRLSETLRTTKVTAPSDAVSIAFSLADIADANILEAHAKRHREGTKLIQQAEAEARPTLARINMSMSQTPTGFYRDLYKKARHCLEMIASLEEGLHHVCPDEIPSFYKIRAVLEEMCRYAKGCLDERQPHLDVGGQVTVSEEMGESTDHVDVKILTPESLQLIPITSRAEAYARLSQAADYLMRTEPHSPAPYLVKRAVAWGSMTLGELYQEIIQDERDLLQLKQLLGVRMQGSKSSVA